MRKIIVGLILLVLLVFSGLLIYSFYEERPDDWFFWKTDEEILHTTLRSKTYDADVISRIAIKYIRKGVRPRDSDLNRTLHYLVVADDEHLDLIEQVINYGAEISNKMFLYAVDFRSTNLVGFLVDNGADMEEKNEYGENALLRAVDYTKLDTVRLLLQKGADVDVRDNAGQTPLMNAAYCRTGYGGDGYRISAKIIDVLVDYGADVYATDNKGRTAYDLAEERHGDSVMHGEKDIFAALERAENKIEQRERRQEASNEWYSKYGVGKKVCVKAWKTKIMGSKKGYCGKIIDNSYSNSKVTIHITSVDCGSLMSNTCPSNSCSNYKCVSWDGYDDIHGGKRCYGDDDTITVSAYCIDD